MILGAETKGATKDTHKPDYANPAGMEVVSEALISYVTIGPVG